MLSREKLIQAVYQLFDDPSHKDELILELFQYQIKNNPLLMAFVESINATKSPSRLNELTFLPISFFKTHDVKCGTWSAEKTFESSGTTGNNTSKHHIKDLSVYHNISKAIFENKYGSLKNKTILALLPSYLERNNSSLVHMVNLFQESSDEDGGFYLNDFESLHDKLLELKKNSKEVILFGVSFALLDFALSYKVEMPSLTIIETGGMKGRRKEMVRTELHLEIKKAFPQSEIHSEYGMTELLSQAYSNGNQFAMNPSFHVSCREIGDPFTEVKKGKTGILNIVDLANIDSICFIATEDLGRVYNDQSFEVLGRADNSMARGCNLLYV